MVKEEEEEKKTKVPQGVKKDETPKISDAFNCMVTNELIISLGFINKIKAAKINSFINTFSV